MAKQKPPDDQLVELKFASDDYKNFLEEKAKYVFKLLFGNLQMMGVWHQRKFREIESSLLLGSMYLRSWLIQLNRSYKYRISLAQKFQLSTAISRNLFGHFLGVRGVTFCDIFAQICPWEW